MFDIVLYEPEIPPNTGNIIRLSANTGCCLHLIEPLGFTLNDRDLRRAGLDYEELTDVHVHASLDAYLTTRTPPQVVGFSTRGAHAMQDLSFVAGAALLFGPETRGLPQSVLDADALNAVARIPMQETTRSLNLSNAVAVAVYEGWRQHGYRKPG